MILFLTGLMSVSYAQYSDWSVGGGSWDKSYSIGLQLGLPLVTGVDISGQFSPRLSASLGFGFVPDLITLGGQLRMNILQPAPEKIVPVVGIGLSQYWLEEDGNNNDTVALHLLAGGQRMFGSSYSLGLYLGYIKSLSEGNDHDISVWGVNGDMSKLFVGIEGRYYF